MNISSDDAIDKINKIKKGIVLLDGPTGSGKTMILLKLKGKLNDKMIIVSYEKLVDSIIEKARNNKSKFIISKEVCEEYLNLKAKVVSIEDIDYLKGKDGICTVIAKTINNLAEKGVKVIITGFNIVNTMQSLTDSLIEYQAISLTKKQI